MATNYANELKYLEKTINILPKNAANNDEPEKEEELFIFWYYTPKGSLKLNFRRMKQWLQDHGYYRFEFVPEKVNFIRIQDNIVEHVTAVDIKNYVLYNLDQWDEEEVYNLVAEHPKFKDEYLAFLDIKSPVFLEDDRQTAWFFYRNTAVKVTSESIETIPYIDISGCIWKTAKLDRDFEIKNSADSDFAKFVSNVCAGNIDRVKSLRTSQGYLLHRFKDTSNVKGIIYYDEQISDKPSGGTGKTMLFQALGKIRELVIIDAKDYNGQNKFALQRVTPSTNIIIFDDLPKNFKVENLFSKMTTGLPIERKNQTEIYLSYKKSPKYGFPSNYTLKGESDSFARRKFEIEIHPFYSAKRQPIDDFKREFWSDQWDEKDWSMFDTYEMESVQMFLKSGLIVPEYVNLASKQLMCQTSTEFYDWAEMNLENGKKYHRNQMFEKFKEDEKGSYCKSTHMFYDWLRAYGEFKGWEIKENVGQGKMYIQFGDAIQGSMELDEASVDDVPF